MCSQSAAGRCHVVFLFETAVVGGDVVVVAVVVQVVGTEVTTQEVHAGAEILTEQRHRLTLQATGGVQVSVVCHSYKLHPHEWSVRGHLYKRITQRVSVECADRVNALREK